MASGERARSTQQRGTPVAGSARAQVAPLYKRLPHGPHRLERREVALNQRARIHGAMIEAVARGGYESTSVRQVIGLAGVSRRSFYEHFTNREACFLATFDVTAARGIRRVTRACGAADGGLEEQLGAAFTELSTIAREDPKSAALVAWEAQGAGAAGLTRLRDVTGACEQMLARSFGESCDGCQLPTAIARGIAGGVQGILTRRMRPGSEPPVEALGEQLLAWTLQFRGAGVSRVGERMRASAARRLAAGALRPGLARARGTGAEPERVRMLESVLLLARNGCLRELSALQIADQAGVAVEAFFALYGGTEACFLAALEMCGKDMLALAAEDALQGPGWAQAVRRAVGAVLGHLAGDPLAAATIAESAFAAGPAALALNLQIAEQLAQRLTAGAPGAGPPRMAVEGIAGALWHTIGAQLAGGRSRLLPLLCDHLAFIVLTPCIGADAAAEALAREPAARSASCG
jgi:AcrR family transcriptional regulator